MTKPTITIDIVSDIVCPWCYIGKRRLEKAIHAMKDDYTFVLEYHPFELNPDMPAAGLNQQEHLTKKFGGPERYAQITTHVTSVAAQEGLTFQFEKQTTSPNTRAAHSIVQLAKEEGKQLEIIEALFKAYFTDGADLSKKENLIEVATNAGLDKFKTSRHLEDENGVLQVALAEKEMSSLGISGIINKKYGISGAQAPETFIQTFKKLDLEKTLTGESCDVESKNC
ncbi:MAG: DsbA family oxidoreductase [Cyclobacteriaceae bacterium]|nr:DsbA family oxidoreductase [Cyclobacteriaceae bacterium]